MQAPCEHLGTLFEKDVCEPTYKHNLNFGAWIKHGQSLTGMKFGVLIKNVGQVLGHRIKTIGKHAQNVFGAYTHK